LALIRARAERRLGELLKAMKDAGQRSGKGGNGANQLGKGNVTPRDISTLKDLGIPRHRASQAIRASTPCRRYNPRMTQQNRIGQ
jgi:hypothetical protein